MDGVGYRIDVRTDESARVIAVPALYVQLGRMLHSVGGPGHVNGVFIGGLNPAAVVVRECGIGEVVVGGHGGGGACGERGCRAGSCGRVGLRGCGEEILDEDEDEACGGEEAVRDAHPGIDHWFNIVNREWMNSSSRWSNVKGVGPLFDLIQLISIKRLHPSGRAKAEGFGGHICLCFVWSRVRYDV